MATVESEAQKLVLKIANDCIKEVPVLVVGSGASAAYGIRGMSGLSEYLIQHVRPSAEDVGDWDAFRRKLTAYADLEKALQEVTMSSGLLSRIVAVTRQMIVEDEQQVFSEILEKGQSLALEVLTRYLFRTIHMTLDIVTTNYDRLVEFAVCRGGYEAITGFSHGDYRQFVGRSMSPRRGSRRAGGKVVNVWKVHGSVDWFEDPRGNVVGLAGHLKAPPSFTPQIVTPGLSKYRQTHDEPFRTVISAADRALSAARGFLCVGYGFSDDHIEPKLIDRTRTSKTPTVILARSLRPGALAFLRRKLHANIVAFVRHTSGTVAYTPENESGVVFENRDLWSLDGFLKELGISE